jgi:protein phosphatase
VQLKFYQLTSAGNRELNQDYMAHIIQDDYALFVVADGLGGHYGGEKASRFFCHGLMQCAPAYSKRMVQNPPETFSAWIAAAVAEMKTLFCGDTSLYEAHTTCAILYLDKRLVLTGHCGDSRIYRMNPRQILWRSKDHSIPQQLLQQGRISEQEVGRHPEQNVLTRSLNADKAHKVEINLYPGVKKGETFIVCSDGFWGAIKEAELLHLAQLCSGKVELGKLAGLSVLRANGKADNSTVQWIRCL